MNTQEHLLTVLAEECGEVAKECHKALRFGIDDVWEGKLQLDQIINELNDLMGAINKLVEANILEPDWLDLTQVQEKMDKIAKYMRYAQEHGALEIPVVGEL